MTIDLSRYKVGDTLDDLDGRAVAQCYGTTPEWYRLNGSVTVFVSGTNTKKSLSATDGVRLVKLSSYQPSSKPDRVKAAFRAAIKGQVATALAETSWPCICPISGITLHKANRASYHVDHRSVQPGTYPFSTILHHFLAKNRLNMRQIVLDGSGRLPAELVTSWQDYHHKHSDLVVVDARTNMAKGARLDRNLWKKSENEP